jgi:hypothetical protein
MTHEEASALLAAFALDAVGDVERERIRRNACAAGPSSTRTAR